MHKQALDPVIPVLDTTAGNFAAELRRASQDIGIVSSSDTAFRTLFDRVRSMLRTLFALTNKASSLVEPRNYRGFIPLKPPNRVEANGDQGDRYEGYKLHWECPPDHPVMAACDLYGPNRWPAPQSYRP